MTQTMVREAVAVFTSVKDLEAAIDELLTSGFNRMDLSMLASEDTIEEKLGHAFASTRELEDNPEVPTGAYLARESFGSFEGYAVGGFLYIGVLAGLVPVLASGGAIGAALLAGAIGATGGTAIGSILAAFIGKNHSDYLNEQLQHGGILLWVRTRDAGRERKAVDILSRHSGLDVHVHGLPDKSAVLQKYYSKTESENSQPEIRYITYQDIQITVAPDGHSFAVGRLFASQAEARRFIDMAQLEV